MILKRFRLVLILLFSVVMVGLIVFSVLSARQRTESMTAIAPLPEMVFHKSLVAALQQNTELDSELKASLEVIAAWSALFQRKAEEIDGDEWNRLRDRWKISGGWGGLSS